MDDKISTFLHIIRRAQRGKLKIYLGYGAGVDKTYQMLLEGHQLKKEGIDIAIGLVETHGRAEIAPLIEGLEVIPRTRLSYHGISIEEMDLDAILARKPDVALIDELAHANIPGSRNPKRYQDVQEITDAGIHVITTLNIQHLESLYDTMEKTVHVKVRERIPDAVLEEADQIVNVDLAPEDLRKRLELGKIYPSDRIDVALAHFFTQANLEKLRELTLRELAAQIDLHRRESHAGEDTGAPDQVMVCLNSAGTNSEMLLRYASRLAGRLNRNWYALYVQTPHEDPTVIEARTQKPLSGTITLAKQLGAIVFTAKGVDVVDSILRFAREYRVGHVVVGKSRPLPLWKRLFGKKSIVERLVTVAKGPTVVIWDTWRENMPEAGSRHEAQAEATHSQIHDVLHLSSFVSASRIVIWDEPVSKETLLRDLVEAAAKEGGIEQPEAVLRTIMGREEVGSAFFNDEVAVPHARIDRLEPPLVAIGRPQKGVKDTMTAGPVELVFLILSPAQPPEVQTWILALAGRVAQNRHLMSTLTTAKTPAELMEALSGWELSKIR